MIGRVPREIDEDIDSIGTNAAGGRNVREMGEPRCSIWMTC